MVDKVIVLCNPFVSCLESGTVFLLSFKYVGVFWNSFPLLCFDSWISSEVTCASTNMSNTFGNNILHQSLLRPPVVEPQNKLNSSGISANTLFKAAYWNQAAAQTRKSPLSSKFLGNNLNVQKPNLAMGSHRPVKFNLRAVLATDPASEVIFRLLKMAA